MFEIIKPWTKDIGVRHPTANCFRHVLRYSGLVGLCFAAYMTISHNMHVGFAEMWHLETSYFHLPRGEMTITIDDVSCLMHLPIKGKLLGHMRIGRAEGVDMVVTHLGVEPAEVSQEAPDTICVHASFSFWKIFIKTICKRLWTPKAITCRLSTTRLAHWSIASCSWLTHLFLWTKVKPMFTWLQFMSTTRGTPVWLPTLEAGHKLFLEDK